MGDSASSGEWASAGCKDDRRLQRLRRRIGLAYLNPSRVEGFRYDANSGIVPLGTLTGGRSRASTVSADGKVVAGWDDLTGRGSGVGYWFGTIWWDGMQHL